MLIKPLNIFVLLMPVLIREQALAEEHHRDGQEEHRGYQHGEPRGHFEALKNPYVRWYRGADIHHFHERDFDRWHGGNWRHGHHNGVSAWWWVVNGYWYAYPRPFYPYPAPYQPAEIILQQPPVEMIEQSPSATGSDNTQQATQYWYYCAKPAGYYPYVAKCAGGWKKVPATSALQ